MTSSTSVKRRSSKVPGIGEDFAGSALHKRYQWVSLPQAEIDGTAAQLVTRDELLKTEPHQLLETITEVSSLSHLASFWILKAYAPKPYSPEEYQCYQTLVQRIQVRKPETPPPKSESDLRRQYYEAYVELKDFLEKAASQNTDPLQILLQSRQWVSTKVSKLQATDPFNPVGNNLADFQKRIHYNAKGTYKKSQIGYKIQQVIQAVQANPQLAPIKDIAQRLIKEEPLDKVLETSQAKPKKFRAANYYSNPVRRVGGRSFEKYDEHLLLNHFRLRGVQFGNYLSDTERADCMQFMPEALADLADVVGWRDEQVSLPVKIMRKGEAPVALGIGQGARGSGHGIAHYEPLLHVMNLTRKRAGALAHEWFHAFDHCLTGQILDTEGKTSDYLSKDARIYVIRKRDGSEHPHPVLPAMIQLYQSIKDCGYHDRMKTVLIQMCREKQVSKPQANYWASPEEQSARAFERYIQHKLIDADRDNSYLAGGLEHPIWMTDPEIEAITPAMDKLMTAAKHYWWGN